MNPISPFPKRPSDSALGPHDPTLARYAERLRERIGAERVLLFGSHARGAGGADSHYDLIVVAERFGVLPRLRRASGLRDLFYEVGGNAPLDLICLTPAEFDQAQQRITLVSAVLPEAVDLLAPASPVTGHRPPTHG